jgi:hypothetical protein
MPVPASPLIRLVCHLLLGLAVVLQAGAAGAMHDGKASGDADASTVATAEHDAPPCHAAANDAAPTTPDGDCCDGSPLGKLCQWACAQAMSLAGASPIVPMPARHLERSTAPVPAAASWTPSTPLRPPIA